jgi:hypothetical protein
VRVFLPAFFALLQPFFFGFLGRARCAHFFMKRFVFALAFFLARFRRARVDGAPAFFALVLARFVLVLAFFPSGALTLASPLLGRFVGGMRLAFGAQVVASGERAGSGAGAGALSAAPRVGGAWFAHR